MNFSNAVSKMGGALNSIPSIDVGGVKLAMKSGSPKILMAAGVLGFVGTVVLASKATLKVASEVTPEHQLKMRLVEDNLNKNDEYGEKDYNHDRFVVLAQTATIIGKEYAPSILVGGATLACFFGAYNIMQKRNVALAAAYSLVQTAFNEYRARVKEEMGDEYDSHFRYGYELKKTKKSKGSDSGKKFDIVKPENGFGQMSMYSRLFGPYEFDVETGQYEGTRMFMNNHEMNYLALRNAQNRLNDRLRLSGHVFLNDVYDFLGLTRTKAGQIVGWKYMGEEDEGIEFMHTVDLFSYSDKDPILLDFNVMGPIINDMPELQ